MTGTITIDATGLSGQRLQSILQSAIAPRPIGLVSTINNKGDVNLSPFSFFNLFSISPPVCVFSPSRRLRDNSTKHTLENIKEIPECVIHIVTYSMVNQVSLASCEYPEGVNEFIKSGLTMVPSEKIRPPRVLESPVQMECLIRQIMPLGDQAGSGNLVLAEIIRIHISEHVLDKDGLPDPAAMDLVARLGGNWYARVTKENLFQVEKPNQQLGLGFDQLPDIIVNANWLTENQKAQLANLTRLPEKAEATAVLDEKLMNLFNNKPADFQSRWQQEIIHNLNGGSVWKAACMVILM